MLRVDRTARELTPLEPRPLPDAGLTERGDIQRMICNSPEAFFGEIGERLLLLGEEVRPAEFVDDRIDLLALDERGAVVVIELKRGNHKLHLLQALGYAATIAHWDRGQLLDERSRHAGQSSDETEEELEEFLDAAGTLNQAQRVILIAEDFDYMVLATADWLGERFGVDIRCYRLRLSADGEQEFLTCTCIYPPPELAQHAVRRGRRDATKTLRWSDWDAALASIENIAIVDFFRSELTHGRESALRHRVLHYRLGGRRRFGVVARQKEGYVWQNGRFDGDETFWRQRLSKPEKVGTVRGGTKVRFSLCTAADFHGFREAMAGPLQRVAFLDAGEDSENHVELSDPWSEGVGDAQMKLKKEVTDIGPWTDGQPTLRPSDDVR